LASERAEGRRERELAIVGRLDELPRVDGAQRGMLAREDLGDHIAARVRARTQVREDVDRGPLAEDRLRA
jgi:hypothetical protein